MESSSSNQDFSMPITPRKQHEWLRKLIGEWEYETDAQMEEGRPPEKFRGAETVRSLGKLWIVAEGHGQSPTGEAEMLITLGYDPFSNRFRGTWVGSMMTYLWVYDDGELDESANKLSLMCEGPSMSPEGGTAQYKDVIEFKSDDHRTLTAYVKGEDGSWQHMMTTHYHRKK